MLYLIEFLHQTTTKKNLVNKTFGCILLNFYIKPQQSKDGLSVAVLYLIEFLHQTTTTRPTYCRTLVLYLIEFLHQTTTSHSSHSVMESCILLNFYIKPQRKNYRLYFDRGCILLNFYIKPQRRDGYRLILRILQPFDDSRNLLSVRRRSRFDVFFRISKNKYSKISQKNSNCWGISGFARSLFPQKFRISPYCLSVTARMLV